MPTRQGRHPKTNMSFHSKIPAAQQDARERLEEVHPTVTIEEFLAAGKRQQQKQERRKAKVEKFDTASKEFFNAMKEIFGEKMPFFIPSKVTVHKDKSKCDRIRPIKWKNLDPAETMEGDFWKVCMYDALTEEEHDGCIQIKLGPDSHHLRTINVDADELVQPVLDAFPELAKTLQVLGSKGLLTLISEKLAGTEGQNGH